MTIGDLIVEYKRLVAETANLQRLLEAHWIVERMMRDRILDLESTLEALTTISSN